MTTPSLRDATAHVAAVAGVDGAEQLLENSALSGLVGHPVSVQHLRLKTGRSVHVAWRTVDDSPARWGWAEVTADPDKADKAVLRAEAAGETVELRRGDGAALLWGGLHGDRGLAKELRGARVALGEDLPWEVLRYNPGKRVVARLDDGTGPVVLRVSRGTASFLEASRRWAEAGVPTLVPTPVGGRGSAVLTPWWGSSDLHRLPRTAAALEAGRLVGALHQGSRGRVWPGQVRREATAAVTAAGLLEVAPWLRGRVIAIAHQLEARLGELTQNEPAWVHGDLSPDQVLHDGGDDIRVIDLDRAGSGPAALDVGSWLAACASMGLPQLSEPFLTGYTESTGVDDRSLAISEALAQFRAAVDPFRKLRRDWPQAITRRIELAEQALGRIS